MLTTIINHVAYAITFVLIIVQVLLLNIKSFILPHKSTKKYNNNKHIAIIGGGIAGCSAAYSLVQSGYNVTIYESRAVLGGNSKTYEWSIDIHNTQHKLTTGLSVLAWPKQYFHNYIELLNRLNVETVDVKLPFAIQQHKYDDANDSIYAHNMSTKLSQHYTSDTTKWCSMVKLVNTVSEYLNGTEKSMYHLSFLNPFNLIPLRMLCYIYGISSEFWHNIVVSMYQSSFLTVNLNTIPSTILPVVDGLISIDTLRIPTMVTWNTNSTDVFNKLTTGATVKTNHPVLRVQINHTNDNRRQIYIDNDTTVYDNVIFACSSYAAINALENGNNNIPTSLTTMLHSITYTEHTDNSLLTGIVHTDDTILPVDVRTKLQSEYANYIDVQYNKHTQQYNYHNTFILSSWMPQLQQLIKQHNLPHTGIESMYVTYAAPDNQPNIDPKQIKHYVNNKYAHPNLSYRNQAVALLLRYYQGDNGIYFCGNYSTPANGHDLSLLSGFAVAERIGAKYPFTENKQAYRDFIRLKRVMGLS